MLPRTDYVRGQISEHTFMFAPNGSDCLYILIIQSKIGYSETRILCKCYSVIYHRDSFSQIQLPAILRNLHCLTKLHDILLVLDYIKLIKAIDHKFLWLIIKITISSIVIGLKNSDFPLIHLSSCYRTVCYRTVQ